MTAEAQRLERWQGLTIALLFAGYAGCYLCRSNLSVTLPLIIDDLARGGMDPGRAKISLGFVTSMGVLAYAAGKIALGAIADFWGGKRNFMTAMGGAILFTFVFALAGGMPLFTMAWVGNRTSQSMGWSGLIKITSRWFNYSSYGKVMGVLSLSYLFGDALARKFMSLLIAAGFNWRQVFYAAGGTLALIFLANAVLLKESRRMIGAADPEVNPENLFENSGDEKPASIGELLAPMARSGAFWIVCVIALGATLVRETFNTWTPTYFHQVAGYSQAQSAELSALFPLMGGFSVLLAGYIGDRLGRDGRSMVMVFGLSLTVAALAGLGVLSANPGWMAPVLVSIVALGLIGPFSFLGGAIALDFGGKQGGAAASGIIDGIGYLAGVLAGDSVARLSVSFGWNTAFLVLAGVALSAAVASLVLRLRHRRG